MPQIVTKQIAAADHPLIITTTTLLPGLSATVLTGSGWINIRVALEITFAFAGLAIVTTQLKIDGVLQGIDSIGASVQNGAQYDLRRLSLDYLARMGAGAHVIEVFAFTNAVVTSVTARRGYLIIDEVGY